MEVSGSNDGTTWTPLVTNGLVFDYSRYMNVSNRELRLPKNQFRQFRVVVDDITDAQRSPFVELTRKSHAGVEQERIERTVLERRPMRIQRLEFWGESARKMSEQEKLTDYPVAEFRVEADQPHKSTIVYARRGTSR